MPGPFFVRPSPVPVIFEAIVIELAALYWLTIKSVVLPDVRLPPVIVTALLPKALVSRMPPLATVIVPVAIVMVVAAPVLNRSELIVSPPSVMPLPLASLSTPGVSARR